MEMTKSVEDTMQITKIKICRGSRLRDTVVMATLRETRYTDEQCWSIVKEVNGVRASGITEEEGQECRTGQTVVTFLKDNLRVDVCIVPR